MVLEDIGGIYELHCLSGPSFVLWKALGARVYCWTWSVDASGGSLEFALFALKIAFVT